MAGMSAGAAKGFLGSTNGGISNFKLNAALSATISNMHIKARSIMRRQAIDESLPINVCSEIVVTERDRSFLDRSRHLPNRQ